MGWRDIFKRSLSTAEHVHFVDFVISQFFDWRSWAVFMLTGLISYFGLPAIRDWSPLRITLTSIAVGGSCSLMYVGYAVFRERGQRHRDSKASSGQPAVTATATPDEPIIYVDASVAFFDILENSDWSREQRPIEHAISDWLSRRLDDEIHNRLLQGRLRAWGRECLTPFDEAPEDIIPKEKWAKIEIDFSNQPRTCAVGRVKRNGVKVTTYAGIKFCKKEIYEAFPPTDEEISLLEAATATYERIQYHDSVIAMEAFADSSNDILVNVCKTLTEFRDGREPLLKLFGNKPPSRIKERIFTDALNRWEFVIEGKKIIFREPSGHFQYENLTVKLHRLEEAIQKLTERYA
jgi:hypothetical protein